MAIRNFWVEGMADGKKTLVGFGPRRKDGGFDLEILIREKGGISDSRIEVTGREIAGILILVGRDETGAELFRIEKER